MKAKLLAVLIANLMVATGAMAQDSGDGMTVSGTVGAGVRSTTSKTNDGAMLNEYRDLGSGALGLFDIKGRSRDYWIDAYGENLGRADQYLNLRGGRYSMFRYELYENAIIHNWAFSARTPYGGVGGATLTGTLPNLNPATWGAFDMREKRKDIGGNFEFSGSSPWYVRVDGNQVTQDGLRLIAGSNGTSPGNGYNDKPFPVDYVTRNLSLEGGYATKKGSFSVSVLHSKFSNANDTFRWQNAFFNNQLDTSWLPADNDYTKYSANGVLRQLPMGSTLAGRISMSKTTSAIPIAGTALNTNGVFGATNPSASSFAGEVVHETASLSLHSNPTRQLDSRLYFNWFKKENNSTIVTFTNPATGLNCGGASCVTEAMGYKKTNFGADVGYRINPENRLVFGLDFVDLKRDRVDFDQTKDTRASVEYRNNSLDALSMRMKYQHLQRRSHFLQGADGTNANDPNYLNRYVARFDAANVDQDLLKFVLDAQPAKHWDLGAELIVKRNNYKDTTLGRTNDERQELYFSVGYGDPSSFRVLAFADVEFVKYDSYHRNISGPLNADGSCSAAAANCFDPFAAATTNNYNWQALNRDKNYSIGFGADWKPNDRLKLSGSLVWQQTQGVVDFAVQAPANPAVSPTRINNFDNTRRLTLNLRGTYALNKNVDLMAGYSFDRFRFSDIAYDGYTYTIGTGTSASHLSGVLANPNYTAQIVYLMAMYRFP
jgi:MtrB/PioB family decaheme-associated outer membrane protein